MANGLLRPPSDPFSFLPPAAAGGASHYYPPSDLLPPPPPFSPLKVLTGREGGTVLILVAELGEIHRQIKENWRRSAEVPYMARPSEKSAMSPHHKYHEVLQPKQGRFSEIPPRISELLKSNCLDDAPTQSLISVVNGMLDESTETKNGEIPDKVACLLKKVVQEIERRILAQAEHIIIQNNLFKEREDKYRARIKVLETLSIGTTEEAQMAQDQLRQIKKDKTKSYEKKKEEELKLTRFMKEKEESDRVIERLKEDIQMNNKLHQRHCLQLETMVKEAKGELEEMKKELDEKKKEFISLVAESKKREAELEKSSDSRTQSWKKKEDIYQRVVGYQLQALQDLRLTSDYIRQEVVNAHKNWTEEYSSLGNKFRELAGAADNYHKVLAENRKIYNELQELKGNIRVYCRIRPFLSCENGRESTVECIGNDGELVLANPSKQGKDGRRLFKFNKVFGPAASQEEVYLDTQPLVRSVLDGFNVCIFAYGQTGSGKTYTMSGLNSPSKETWGVNYRALNDLFDISKTRRSSILYEVDVQMVEIYNEQVRDLLSNNGPQKSLGIRNNSQSNGLTVPDACVQSVNSTLDVLELMQLGQTNRAMSSTALNERSSRSHSVLTVHVRGKELKTESSWHGCLHLIDLAGSERIDRSEVTGDRLREALHINKSLSALGDVISALSQKSSHVPYRNSKLTQLLQSSLGGHAKTLMFVQMNPDVDSYSETLSTLKFAERVAGVELGITRSNKEGKDVRELMEQVASLKDMITRKDEEIEQSYLIKGGHSPNSDGGKHGSDISGHSLSSSSSFLSGASCLSGRNFSGQITGQKPSSYPEVSEVKASQATKSRVPTQISRLPSQKTRSTATTQLKLKDSHNTPLSPRKSAIGQMANSVSRTSGRR